MRYTSNERQRVERRLISKATEDGYLLTPQAIDSLLEAADDPESLLSDLINWLRSSGFKAPYIENGHVSDYLTRRAGTREVLETSNEATIEVLSPDYTDIWIEGDIEETTTYLIGRYYRLRRVIEERGLPIVSISEASRTSQREIYVVGSVTEKIDTKSGALLVLEDPTSSIKAYVPASERRLQEPLEEVVPDVVVAVRLVKRDNTSVIKEIIYPDIANVSERPKGPDVKVCVISDLHVGSKRFSEDAFQEFLDWLHSREASRVKCLVINGDLIDGVYVYPGQEKELALASLSDQFREAGRLLKEVRDDIKIIYVPGNHEPVRKTIPQPPVQQRFREILDSSREVSYCGNPAKLRIGGNTMLFFHGQTFDDVIHSSTGYSYSNLVNDLNRLMTFFIRCRTLAPTFGDSTPVLPTKVDHLFIDEVPSLFATGHVHVASMTTYKGVSLVNSGTWQEQTSYQRAVGLIPTVGTAAIYDLRTSTAYIRKFG
ncbi:MAG: metallophosphoesterase [Aigarchaeota archaeon]|nr:metallophosphoesterase [Aigarchaeota archaeon]MDW8093054.1 metallophosphoesterase [Nitrososphaerota archaeon]